MPGAYLWGWDAGNSVWREVVVNNEGKLIIDPTEVTLDKLGNVNAPGPANDDILTFDTPTGLWISEAPRYGFNSRARAYRSASTQNIQATTWVVPYLDVENYDGLGEFDSSAKTGTADATEANKLHDADGGFAVGDVGAQVWNTTDDTYAVVTAFIDSGELTLSANIMVSGEAYTLYHNRFVATTAGYYIVHAGLLISSIPTNKDIILAILRNSAFYTEYQTQGRGGYWSGSQVSDIVPLDAGGFIQMGVYNADGVKHAIYNTSYFTYLAIHRLS